MSEFWNPVTVRLRTDLDKLSEDLRDAFFDGIMETRIRANLKTYPDSTNKQIMSVCFRQGNILLWHSFYFVWQRLEKTGEIVGTGHGRGKSKTWRLKQ